MASFTLTGLHSHNWKPLGNGKYAIRVYPNSLEEPTGALDVLHPGAINAFSFAMRLKSLTVASGSSRDLRDILFGRGNDSTHRYEFCSRETGVKGIQFNITNNSSNYILRRSTTRVPRHKWCVVGMTYDGSRRGEGVTLYLDGKLLKSSYTNVGEITYTPPSSSAPFYIGGPDMEVDWCVFWNRALTPSEMKGVAVLDPGLGPDRIYTGTGTGQ